MTLTNIFAAISLGRKLITTIADLRRDIRSAGPESDRTETPPTQFQALESRLGGLESQIREYHARVITLEQKLSDVLRATEALAERVSKIFWIASIAAGLGLISLILALIALTRAVR